MTKTVYSYTGQKKTLDSTDLCPISKKWLIPAGYTAISPLKSKAGYSQEFDPRKNSWSYKKINTADTGVSKTAPEQTDLSTATSSSTQHAGYGGSTTAAELQSQIAMLAQTLADMQTKLAAIA